MTDPSALSIVAGFTAAWALITLLTVGLVAASKGQMPTPNAAPAPDTPPRVPVRATPREVLLCAVNGHTTVDWARLNGRPICLTCDRLLPREGDLPFDREAAELVAETEACLRGVA